MAENQPGAFFTHEQNRMKHDISFAEYGTRLRDFIRRHSPDMGTGEPASHKETEVEFRQLALTLFTLQFERNAPYRKICRARGVDPPIVASWSDIPAVPTAAFKELQLTSLLEQERVAVFHSSGTTNQRPSRHFHNRESLELYQVSLCAWFQRHFLPAADGRRGGNSTPFPLRLVVLTPAPSEAPHSSLAHMFDTVRRQFGSTDSFFAGRVDPSGAWTLNGEAVLQALAQAGDADRPIGLLGAAFSFVQLLDDLADKNVRFRLGAGSRALETGGYKGRTRTLLKAELHSLMAEHLGIPTTRIVCEYGMSELSSQAYDWTVADANSPPAALDPQPPARLFHFPPWARVQIISPETGRLVNEGETGLIRVFDLANARSVLAIQTEDLGTRHGDGFALLGRAALAEARGCSLMVGQG